MQAEKGQNVFHGQITVKVYLLDADSPGLARNSSGVIEEADERPSAERPR